MYGRARTGARFLALAMLAPLAAACTTTAPTSTATPGQTEAPVSAPSISLPRFTSTAYVDPALSRPCITAAANSISCRSASFPQSIPAPAPMAARMWI